jgi:hypothetical protein
VTDFPNHFTPHFYTNSHASLTTQLLLSGPSRPLLRLRSLLACLLASFTYSLIPSTSSTISSASASTSASPRSDPFLRRVRGSAVWQSLFVPRLADLCAARSGLCSQPACQALPPTTTYLAFQPSNSDSRWIINGQTTLILQGLDDTTETLNQTSLQCLASTMLAKPSLQSASHTNNIRAAWGLMVSQWDRHQIRALLR